MSIAYDTFIPSVLASALPVEPIGDKIIPIPEITNHGAKTDTNPSYTQDYGKGVYSDTHNTVDYVYSGVYIINTLTPNDSEGHIFNFGTFSDDVSINAYVWNATNEVQTLSSKTFIGDTSNIDINYDTITLKPTQEILVTITASADGDPIIDGTVTSNYTTTATPIKVQGSRVLVWIFEQNKEKSDSFEFLTNISQAYDREYRTALREVPSFKANRSYQLIDQEGYALLNEYARKSFKSKYSFPLWEKSKYFYKELTIGTTAIDYEEIYNESFEDSLNILIYKDNRNYEVVQIDNISGDTINLRAEVKNYYDRFQIVPLYSGFVKNISIQNINKYSTFDVQIITNQIPKENGNIPFTTYNNLYVNDWIYTEEQSREVTQDTNIITSGMGLFDISENRFYNNDIFGIQHIIDTTLLEDFKAFIFDCNGQQKPFWLLSRKDEFEFLGFNGTNYSQILIDSYTTATGFNDAHIYFLDAEGNYHFRKVTNIDNTANYNFTLTLDTALASDISVVQTGFMLLVRLNSDIVTIEDISSRTHKVNLSCLRLHREEKEL
ncbi:hypothetical protein LO80_03145 [Candidatus Francisella endociliophora]|uniref:Uncharacterized protein n=1 Tax=Candidatus Francisella endociliophora TaxID=653937 RepID=A0A097ENC6_9GAMM|nr:hypothetical protein [Francisella sp. FSC1006]AIT09068.1 hypothetical protein LO80_03145 [Francisella sp. FSC1006]